MITWRLDRLRSAGPLCAFLAALIPITIAVAVATQSSVDNVLGGLLVSTALIVLGTVIGSMATSGLGSLLFGVVCVAAEASTVVLFGVGVGLFVTLMIHDVASTLRRDPSFDRSIWTTTAATAATVGVVAAVILAIAYLVATATTWQGLLFPFGIAAIGFAARFAADSHTRAVTKRP